MNQSEVNNLVTLLVAAVAPILAKYMDAATVSQAVGDLVGLAAIVWGVYSHWNMKKVPEGEVK